MEFNKDDVIKVARAVTDEDNYMRMNDSYGRDEGYECVFCCGVGKDGYRVEDSKEIQHETDCPVLVARDLLTGAL